MAAVAALNAFFCFLSSCQENAAFLTNHTLSRQLSFVTSKMAAVAVLKLSF